MACLNGRGCFGKRLRQLVKKIIVLFIIQTTAWFLYTYIEEGFLLTDCIFNQEKINRLKETKKQNVTRQENELYAELDKIFLGDLDRSKFEIYHAEFKSYFNVKEPVPTKVSIHEICTKWYLFTAITLTTVGKSLDTAHLRLIMRFMLHYILIIHILKKSKPLMQS